jgi:hypothetical protein
MKNLYAKCGGILSLFLLLVFLPSPGRAQCPNCNGGIPPTTIVYTDTLAPTNLLSANMNFPQFDPSVGTLTCAVLNYNISGTSTTGVRNLGASTALLLPTDPLYSATGRTEYTFQLTVSAHISGPGINVIKPYNKTYGPDSLGAYGMPDDTLTYGPDQIFASQMGSKNSSSLASYLGTGTVGFNYQISGGLTSLEGGLNYRDQITTFYEGIFTLTYYYCPASSLASSITDFSALRSGRNVDLRWTGQNEQYDNTYEIEISQDGSSFRSITRLPSQVFDTSNATKYQYQYDLAPADAGRLFFRVKKINASGKWGYSPVRTVSLGSTGLPDFQVFPNPAARHMNLEWSSLVTGNLQVSVLNGIGQAVFDRQYSLNSGHTLALDLPAAIQPGIYYLRVRDLAGKNEQLTKLLIQ